MLVALGLAIAAGPAPAADLLGFDELYAGGGALGLAFATKLVSHKGRAVTMRGFMAPPLKPESDFFVLTREPVMVCPFCAADAEWPSDIVVIYLRRATAPMKFSDMIEVTGRLDVGSWTDPATGFVSHIRLVDAELSHAR